eukprot:Phypoly_transcript_09703.p1 GENE.Phypoly_transcript_09703~~Phypoly_transcript_09703.p1  ORF type:complete len:187 (-),score=18.88 Phypoly_transcript_09703:819-1379(-)
MVMVSTKELDLRDVTTRPNHALSARFVGPYPILERISPTSFKLQLPSHVELHPVIHVSQLKPYHSPTQFPGRPAPARAANLLPGKDDWVVSQIIGHRVNGGVREFLVTWTHRPPEDASWVPGHSLENAHELIVAYDRSLVPAKPIPWHNRCKKFPPTSLPISAKPVPWHNRRKKPLSTHSASNAST